MATHDGEETGNRRQGKCMIEIIIPGKPIAKKRPRFARRGKFTTTYSDQETEESKFMAQVLATLGKDWQTLTGPLFMEIHFDFPRPKNHYGTGKNADKIKANAPKFHIIKPDLDNLEKFVCDCMNGIVFLDDAQVIHISSRKAWADNPITKIIIGSMT